LVQGLGKNKANPGSILSEFYWFYRENDHLQKHHASVVYLELENDHLQIKNASAVYLKHENDQQTPLLIILRA